MKNNHRIILIGILLLSVVMTGCGKGPGAQRGAGPGAEESEPVERSYNVRTSPVNKQELSSYIDLSGDVEASVSVDVYSDTAGKLVDLRVEPGTTVVKDQVIAQVDPAKPGMNYAVSPVKAPISGTVTAVNVDPGATVAPSLPLLRVGKLDELVITTQVPERFLYMVEQGQTALVTTTSAPGRRYDARVEEISPVVNPVSRTLQVELKMTGASPVKAGMFVGIRLITSTEADALVIPEKALVRRNDETFVYRVKGDQAEKVAVTLGLESEGRVEVVTGLAEGDRVITEGVGLLSDGSLIRVLDEVSFIGNSEEKRS